VLDAPSTFSLDSIVVGRSPRMRTVFDFVQVIADGESNVLIVGETGTGKEMIANLIHHSSRRRRHPFVAVSCAVLTESLIESELFGHEHGAFTGAIKDHPGRFEMADGGTIFLDDIDDVPRAVQVKLLRVLQNRTIERVGGTRQIPVDVRVITGSKRSLQNMARDGQFREDLFYRLNVFPIFVPSLRDRRDDIDALARHFVARFAAEENKPVNGLTQDASDLLQKFNWPGNVRQLENTIFRAVVLCDGAMLDVCDFPQIAAALGVEARGHRVPAMSSVLPTGHVPAPGYIAPAAHTPPYALAGTDSTGHMRKLEDIESEVIRMAISRYDGHMSEVARRLGIGRSTLYRKLKELGLEPEGEAPAAEAGGEARHAAG
jgi:DNA-binding NtrC family response regulator